MFLWTAIVMHSRNPAHAFQVMNVVQCIPPGMWDAPHLLQGRLRETSVGVWEDERIENEVLAQTLGLRRRGEISWWKSWWWKAGARAGDPTLQIPHFRSHTSDPTLQIYSYDISQALDRGFFC